MTRGIETELYGGNGIVIRDISPGEYSDTGCETQRLALNHGYLRAFENSDFVVQLRISLHRPVDVAVHLITSRNNSLGELAQN
jgi:hypothetical protein